MRSATLTDSHWAAPHTKLFRFEVEDESEFRFDPGQYVLLASDDTPGLQPRAYSIASPPRLDNTFELCLNRVEHPSSFSGFLFSLQAGARVKLEGPCGTFVLRREPRDSLFVATGTGIAPVRSMIHCLAERSEPLRMTLLFGVRDEHSILFRGEFEQMAAEHPGFRFVPTLSRPGEHWDGATGYVQEHVLRLLDGRGDVDVYVCGLKAMVDDVRSQLDTSGHEPAAVFYEKYD